MGGVAETGGAAVLPTLTACLDQFDHTGQRMVSDDFELRLLPCLAP
ncbi:MAG: hypothetical protein LM550_01820 [Candidatus Contendobacter sp.]|jgi:hypothetical protein|nr:hypothetical protein [Candidatus Contendobacter sp.]